uniref:Putative HNH endonuclease n=1 Tax=uncultured Trebouxia TaxID=1229085 RepID=A0A0S0N366_9CHLO|nr:putative HNH endonuclease [uncultured Trebouxia]
MLLEINGDERKNIVFFFFSPVKNQGNSKCALTGCKPPKNKKDSLKIHHFYSFKTNFSSLFLNSLRFPPKKGILICQSSQKAFHDM